MDKKKDKENPKCHHFYQSPTLLIWRLSCDYSLVRTYIMRELEKWEEKSPGLTKSFHFWVLLYVIIISSLQILNGQTLITVICCQGCNQVNFKSGQIPNVHLLNLFLGFRKKKPGKHCWKTFTGVQRMLGNAPGKIATGYYSRHRLYQKKCRKDFRSCFLWTFPEIFETPGKPIFIVAYMILCKVNGSWGQYYCYFV